MPVIRYTSPSRGAVLIDLDKDILAIGRGRDCEIQLAEDNMVSRRHAEIRRLPSGEYAIKDLGSKNGTLVNGAPISTWVLKDGDVVAIGESKLTYKSQK
jgi:pSer/pThr/pTyr-binding forkhead associated (FHA) protein